MKIKISYLPNEKEAAGAVEKAILQIYPNLKPKNSNRHPPYLHKYFATKKYG